MKPHPMARHLKPHFTARELRHFEKDHRRSMTRQEQLERELQARGVGRDTWEYWRRMYGVLPTPAWLLEARERLNCRLFGGRLAGIAIEVTTRPEWAVGAGLNADGSYCPSWRGAGQITIAARLVSRSPLEALGTLVHEMAHQAVHELLGREREDHGPAFVRMCTALAEALDLEPPTMETAHLWPRRPAASRRLAAMLPAAELAAAA